MTAFSAGGWRKASWSPLDPPQLLPYIPTRPVHQSCRDIQSEGEDRDQDNMLGVVVVVMVMEVMVKVMVVMKVVVVVMVVMKMTGLYL